MMRFPAVDGRGGGRAAAGRLRRLVRRGRRQGRGQGERLGCPVGVALSGRTRRPFRPPHLSAPRLAALQGHRGSSAPGDAWRCATLKVPLDWSRPDGRTIGLALIRSRATGGDRIGSLVFNFGGPGGSGVASMPYFATSVSALHKRYDLVSWDPRGVGASQGASAAAATGRSRPPSRWTPHRTPRPRRRRTSRTPPTSARAAGRPPGRCWPMCPPPTPPATWT
ncbi:hypothetical protein LT493_07795 [Streptomyces tricolor]|nr:hypothetical protein [Streptomyces tricolor]